MAQKTELDRFNRRMDELVSHVIRNDVGSPEFRTEYLKAVNLYKRVAQYDVELAWELLPSTMMFAYTFAIGVTSKIFNR